MKGAAQAENLANLRDIFNAHFPDRKLKIMETEKIEELLAMLKARAEERQGVVARLETMASDGARAVDRFSSEALHHAHIAELEFVIEKLQQLLS